MTEGTYMAMSEAEGGMTESWRTWHISGSTCTLTETPVEDMYSSTLEARAASISSGGQDAGTHRAQLTDENRGTLCPGCQHHSQSSHQLQVYYT